MTTKSITSVTDGQKKQLKRVAEDALDRFFAEGALDKEGADKLLAEGDAWQQDIIAAALKLSVTNQFASEEVASSYGYLSGYKLPKPIGDQVKLLNGFFPNLGKANEKLVLQPLPGIFEGCFAIPRWQLVGRTYEEALLKAFDQIKLLWKGKFHNYRQGALGPNRLRLVPKTVKALETLGRQQEGQEILVVGQQFGVRHAGRSVRRAREVMPAYEFGSDPFSVACMLLTHQERLQNLNDLWLDCAGADYDFDGDGQFQDAPYFCFSDGQVKFSTRELGRFFGGCGSVSGAVPQEKT